MKVLPFMLLGVMLAGPAASALTEAKVTDTVVRSEVIQKPQQTIQSGATVATSETLMGKIIGIDTYNKTVTIEDKKGVAWTFKVEDVAPTAWRVGNTVKAEYTVTTNNLVHLTKIKGK